MRTHLCLLAHSMFEPVVKIVGVHYPLVRMLLARDRQCPGGNQR